MPELDKPPARDHQQTAEHQKANIPGELVDARVDVMNAQELVIDEPLYHVKEAPPQKKRSYEGMR